MSGKELGLPYMGSKRKIAKPIIDYILAHNPNAKYVYDLFGGGGAMSFEFLQRKQIKKVVYNELNTGVCELLRKIQVDGVTEDFYSYLNIDKEENLPGYEEFRKINLLTQKSAVSEDEPEVPEVITNSNQNNILKENEENNEIK